MAPISSKGIGLSGIYSTGVGQIQSPGTMQNSATNDQMDLKLRRNKRI